MARRMSSLSTGGGSEDSCWGSASRMLAGGGGGEREGRVAPSPKVRDGREGVAGGGVLGGAGGARELPPGRGTTGGGEGTVGAGRCSSRVSAGVWGGAGRVSQSARAHNPRKGMSTQRRTERPDMSPTMPLRRQSACECC